MFPKSKAELRDFIADQMDLFLLSGGEITQLRPGVAPGAEFSRNQHPKLGVQTA